MKRRVSSLLFLLVGLVLNGCESISTDPAPGGITATETGMSAQSAREWQDRTIRQLAF